MVQGRTLSTLGSCIADGDYIALVGWMLGRGDNCQETNVPVMNGDVMSDADTQKEKPVHG